MQSAQKELLRHLVQLRESGKLELNNYKTDPLPYGDATKESVTVYGCYGGLEVAITFEFQPSQTVVVYTGIGFESRRFPEKLIFQRITISQEGNGSIEMDKETAPKHWFWALDSNITHLMKNALEYVKRQEAFRKDKDLSDKRHNTEQSAREVLSHLAA